MGSEHALMIAGWTVFAILAVAIACVGAYWMFNHRKAAKLKKQQLDLELQKSRIRMIPQVQLQSSGPPMSLPDPFTSNGVTTQVCSTSRPVSLLRNPPGHLTKSGIVPEAEVQEGTAHEQPSEAIEPGIEPGAHEAMVKEYPLEAKSPELRGSLDLDSLCGSSFSSGFPDSWGKTT